MITIYEPQTENQESKAILCARIVSPKQELDTDLWYETTIEYQQYLCPEVSDAFVMAMLIPAISLGEDIVVEGAMSERFYFELQQILIPVLSDAWECKESIKIHCSNLVNIAFHPQGCGTGCSLGVDSLAAIKSLTMDECPSTYKLTHLCLFNAGAFGEGPEANDSFYRTLEYITPYSKEMGLPIVAINSNLYEFYPSDFKLEYCVLTRIMSVVLTMQKLLKTYVIASSYPYCFTKKTKEQEYMDNILIPNSSTESTSFFVANPQMIRSKKTAFVAHDKLVKKYLYVCWREMLVNESLTAKQLIDKDNKPNCGMCEKCCRTCFTLELLGKLNDFKDTFEIERYYQRRISYIARVLARPTFDVHYRDLNALMKETGFNASPKILLRASLIRMYDCLNLRVIKHKLCVILKHLNRKQYQRLRKRWQADSILH